MNPGGEGTRVKKGTGKSRWVRVFYLHDTQVGSQKHKNRKNGLSVRCLFWEIWGKVEDLEFQSHSGSPFSEFLAEFEDYLHTFLSVTLIYWYFADLNMKLILLYNNV